MNKNILSGLSLAVSAALLVACSDSNQPENNTAAAPAASHSTACQAADLVLYNTTVYTSDETQWTAEAVASLGDRMVFVGSTQRLPSIT